MVSGLRELAEESAHRRGASRSSDGLASDLRGTPLAAVLVLRPWSRAGQRRAGAGPREQAKRMHDRLVGVPPSAAVLASMEASIAAGDPLGAANEAMTEPDLLHLVAEELGHALDERAADGVRGPERLHRDGDRHDPRRRAVQHGALGGPGLHGRAGRGVGRLLADRQPALPAARAAAASTCRIPTCSSARMQSTLPGSVLHASDTAGVLTTRAAGEAFFSAGTNRRMWRFTAINFLCRDMEQLNDITRPADRIRQDVARSPGGDSRIFHNTCVGCHSGMDRLAGAYAYYQWDDATMRTTFTRGHRAAQVPDQREHLPRRPRHDGRRLGELLARRPELVARLARTRGEPATAPRASAWRFGMSRAFSECQVRRSSSACACIRPSRPGRPRRGAAHRERVRGQRTTA